MKNRFLFGRTYFSVAKNDVEKVINLCNAMQISFGEIKLCEDEATFYVALFQERKFRREAEKCALQIKLISRKGLPALAIRYKKRMGLMIGAIFTAVMIFIYSGVIWDIRIEGTDEVDKNRIINDLAKCGFEVGTKKSGLNTAVLENQMLIISDEISWISVNVKGTVASVVVRKAEYPPEKPEDPICANAVATTGGIIVGFEDIRGDICVKIGDEVSQGQILISGLSGGGEGEPLRITSAKGSVLAQVEEEIKIEIPKKYQKKVTKSISNGEKYLIFFKNEIKIFSNSRNSRALYDKIDIVDNLYTHDGKKLPFATRTIRYIEYEYIDCERTEEEMKSLAEQKLYRYINEELSESQILTRNTSFEMVGENLVLTCKIRCIKNIAKIQEVEINP